jgi:phage terminase large subunit GpA-like protein
MLVRGGNNPAAALMIPAPIDFGANGKPLPGSLMRYTLNVHELKDRTVAQLRRLEPGTGMVHIPAWLPEEAIAELAAEKKIDGAWVKTGPNELFDLMGYTQANALRLQADRIDWNNPPDWAAPLDGNALLMVADQAAANAVRSSLITPPASPAAAPPPAAPAGWLGDRGRNWFSR